MSGNVILSEASSPIEKDPAIYTTDSALPAHSEWSRYWPLVLVSSVGFSLQGLSTYALGLMMDPLQAEFGWSRAQVSVVSLIPAVLMVVCSPFLGAVIDRWGSRRLAIPSIALTGIALAMISLANGSTAQWLILWLIYGIVSLGTKPTVWTSAVSRAFCSGRGLALGVTLTGAALAQICVPPLTQWLVDDFGWRAAYVGLGIGWCTPALVLAILFLKDVRRDDVPPGQTGRPNAINNAGLSLRQAIRSVPLIRIALSTLLTMFIGTAILVHQIPILTDTGIDRGTAALLASFVGFATIGGNLFSGWMTDRWDASLVGAVTLLAPAAAYFILLQDAVSAVSIVLAMAIIGYTSGAKLQIASYLTAQHAGLRNFGMVFGVMTSMIGIGGGLGSVAAGAVYDRFGGYGPMLWAGIAFSVICSALIFKLGKPAPEAAKGI